MRDDGKPKLLVVGSANLDLVLQVPRLPGPGETVLGGSFSRAWGGKGANQAVGAARLGAEVLFVGRLGRDREGQEFREALQKEGLDPVRLEEDPDHPTGRAFILVEPGGENLIAVAPGANQALLPGQVARARDAFRGADAVLAQLEVPLESVEEAARLAEEAGAPFFLDPAPARPLPDSLLGRVAALTPNRKEGALLAGLDPDSPPEEIGRALLERGPEAVALTLGAGGVLLFLRSERIFLPPFPVEARDATAAGDAFAAALAVGRARGLEWAEACRFAAAAGALAATRLGAQPSLPGLAEVETLLEREEAEE